MQNDNSSCNTLVTLGQYLQQNDSQWQAIKHQAYLHNGWFVPEFIEIAINTIIATYLQKNSIEKFVEKYPTKANFAPKKIGIVMAGNIPLVGFHDLLCVLLSGHKAIVKISSKDTILLPFIIKKIIEINPNLQEYIVQSEMLKDCDAYIATGSNNSARYFESYFAKYPHIIRKNRTSIAILDGTESTEDMENLATDVYQYFGLGCRNVTKIYVPENYNFEKLLHSFNKYAWLENHHKYKNNYDYNLALFLLNKQYYMTNNSILLVENSNLFSPISVLFYETYTDEKKLNQQLANNTEMQCIIGKKYTPFGTAQSPSISQFADGIDTMQFLSNL